MNQLIIKDYHTVSVNEHVAVIGGALLPCHFLVVVNAENRVLGVLTYADLRNATQKCIKDLDFIKPKLDINTTLKEACQLMKLWGADALPVFDKDKFIGVLSLHDVTAHLLENRGRYVEVSHNKMRTTGKNGSCPVFS